VEKNDNHYINFINGIKCLIEGELISTCLSNSNPTDKAPINKYLIVNILKLNYLQKFKGLQLRG